MSPLDRQEAYRLMLCVAAYAHIPHDQIHQAPRFLLSFLSKRDLLEAWDASKVLGEIALLQPHSVRKNNKAGVCALLLPAKEPHDSLILSPANSLDEPYWFEWCKGTSGLFALVFINARTTKDTFPSRHINGEERTYMPFEHTECYLDIECQLDEILLQVCSGVPEQKVVEGIGVALADWVSFKLSRPEAVAALLPTILAPVQGGPPIAARKPSRRRGMTCRKEMQIAP